jgi:phage terminase large subunit-like protein
LLERLPDAERAALEADWPSWAHEGQLPPDEDWDVWVLLAGRGFGKTRAGAEWVLAFARANPGAAIALVAATAEEARAVMVEGRSGLLAVARRDEREAMVWEPSRRRLAMAGGAEAFVYSAANPEGLRGPEHHIAWCDELAKWKRAEATWDNMRLGLRLGTRPRALVTTTPKAVKALKRLLATKGTVLTGGASRSNPHLPEAFIHAVEAVHKGTRFGRQGLDGVLIEDVAGALWSRGLIERSRQSVGGGSIVTSGGSHAAANLAREQLNRVVIGVDPPASADGDACGIVACGLGADGVAYVLGDHTVSGLSPDGWARKVARAAEIWGADRVVAEANNGGKMVETVLRGAGQRLPLKLVHASEAKAARAEPVAALFERGAAKLAGAFPELEDEMAGLKMGGGYEGPGRSPDRADAMVWAMTELMLGIAPAEPRVRGL